jgi:hypothetical protein
MADTIVRLDPDSTIVVIYGADLLAPFLVQAAGSVAAAAEQVALAAGQVALATAQVGLAQTARTGAEAAAAGITTTLASATEVVATEAAGTNYAVDFGTAADGVAGNAVGTPPLTASGVAFSTVGGFAVSGAGTATTTPGLLRAIPNYPTAPGLVKVAPLTGTTAANIRAMGALAQYQDDANYSFWSYDPAGNILFNRVVANSLTATTYTGVAPVNLTSWTFETKSLVDPNKLQTTGNSTYTCSLIYVVGSTVTRTTVQTRVATVLFAPPAWGFVSRVVGSRLQSVVVDTNRSALLRRLADDEALIAKNTPTFSKRITGDPNTRWTSGAYDIPGAVTESIAIDTFTGANGQTVGTGGAHVPDFEASNLPTGYVTFGTMPWQILGNQLAPVGPSVDGQKHATLVCAVAKPISRTWFETSRGIELSFDLTLPVGTTGGSGAFLRVPGGAFLIEVAAGQIRVLYRTDIVTGSATRATYVLNMPTTLPISLRCVVRAYESGGILAQIGNTSVAWGWAPNPKELSGLPVTHAGVYIVPGGTQDGVRFDNLQIGPVPAVGGSRYRSLPPLATAISPKFTKQGIVFDEDAADTGHGVLNWSVVNMAAIAPALGLTIPAGQEYRAYYSTDHDTADGGIWYATAPAPTGPWTRRGGAGLTGRIFSDGTNRQCETPVVKYDPVGNRLLMTYQIYVTPGVNNQQTKVASSPDGLTWTAIDYIYPWALTALATNHARHTGYMSWGRDPLGVVPGWIGWSRLFPASDTSTCATTRSPDGVHWEMDLLPTYFPFLMNNLADSRIIHNHGYATEPFAYQGQRLMIVAPFRSASIGTSMGYLALVRLGDDMRNMSAQEVIPFPLTTAEELSGQVVVSGILVESNILYVYYQCNSGSIHLATADLSKGPDGLSRPFGV